MAAEAEIWKEIVGFEGNYKISTHGRVYSQLSKKMLTPNKHNSGYNVVKLIKDNERKTFLIHRLVVETFNGKIDDELVVEHIDRNKQNNNLINLRVVSRSEK